MNVFWIFQKLRGGTCYMIQLNLTSNLFEDLYLLVIFRKGTQRKHEKLAFFAFPINACERHP